MNTSLLYFLPHAPVYPRRSTCRGGPPLPPSWLSRGSGKSRRVARSIVRALSKAIMSLCLLLCPPSICRGVRTTGSEMSGLSTVAWWGQESALLIFSASRKALSLTSLYLGSHLYVFELTLADTLQWYAGMCNVWAREPLADRLSLCGS